MYYILPFFLAALGLARQDQIPLNTIRSSSSTVVALQPCALVSAASASYLSATPTAVTAIVDGELFHDCLKSIPINTTAAISLLQSLEPYIELQSTLSFLADPPAGYPFAAVDIRRSLQDSIGDVTIGKYTAEYHFQTDLYRLFLSARDGHFSFIPDLFGVGSFKVPGAALVSVSVDGVEAPEVFLHSDMLDLGEDDDGLFLNKAPTLHPHAPSSVTTINDMPTLEYLSRRTDDFAFHDRDAAYNFLFSEVAQMIQSDSTGGFANPPFYPGHETMLQLANATTTTKLVFRTVAELRADFGGVNDGPSAYTKFCVRDRPNWATVAPPPAIVPSDPAPAPAGETVAVSPSYQSYPEAVVQDPWMRVAGFFLEPPKVNDTAVLVILSFAAGGSSTADDGEEEGSPLSNFQATVASFLTQCRAAGKKRLIIDLFANGGGVVELGLDTFTQLFPTAEDSRSMGNMRASQVLYDLGRGVSMNIDDNDEGDAVGQDAYAVRSTLKPDGTQWAGGWDELFGGVETVSSLSGPDTRKFTSTFQSNVSVSAPRGFRFTQHTSSSAEPVFDAANMIILTDGYCASTCAMFFELLRRQGVKSVVAGGRPHSPYHPADSDSECSSASSPKKQSPTREKRMQALGTTKGRAFWSFRSLLLASERSHSHSSARESSSGREQGGNGTNPLLTDIPLRRTFFPEGAGVNGVNHLRLPAHGGGDKTEEKIDEIPLQFTRDEADAHVFFTREMLVDKSLLWERVLAAEF